MKHETSHTFAALMSLLVEQGMSRDEARLAAAWLMDRHLESDFKVAQKFERERSSAAA